MAVTGMRATQEEVHRQQIERLVASPQLHGSESLCKLLHYLAVHAETHPGVTVKEHQIATEVFGREASFDPRLDAIVRVQTGRLRTKLAEYYGSTGAHDPVLVELPKGSYSLTFQTRTVTPEPSKGESVPAPPAAPSAPAEPTRWEARSNLTLLLSVATLLAVCAIAVVGLMDRAAAPTIKEPARSVALRTFWTAFLDSGESPLIVYSNAEFVGRPETGLRYFDAQRDRPEQILDHYTGVGEVIAVHELGRLFGEFGRTIRVKRGRLLSLDDVKSNNLVFIGSPSENLLLRELPGPQEFVFRAPAEASRRNDLAIVNTRPKPGEQAEYLASSQPPIKEDYALVSFQPGLNPGRQILLVAGTTTLGTQAAVEFVCRPKQVEGLLRRLGGTGKEFFEAVLKVKISGGVPVLSEVVALHRTS